MFSKLFKKKTKYIQEFTTRILELDLEPGWIEDTETTEPLTFIKEKDGKGALQISFVTIQDQKIPTAEELLKDKEKPNDIKEYKIREWTVYEFEEPTKELYNKNYFL